MADARKQDFNLVLTHYGLERLLYRLSISPHAPNFLLKGALLFSLWYDIPHRPTRDADLLGFGADDIGSVVAVFQDICRIASEDGIDFDPQQVVGSEIRKDAGYGGVRIEILAKLDGARLTLQVDIGFGDAVTPAPEAIEYPVLLSDLPSPQLRSYPKYTVVAEKFHAICLLGMANSRMKDYFDLWILLGEGTLDPREMKRAIEATFARRKMAMPAVMPVGLSDGFAADIGKQVQWQAFLRKNRLGLIQIADVVGRLRDAFIKSGVVPP
ncbi:MAG: nucleotidyl transferase AbiEii/AbiGii toxin family protein [Stagnimonas sp.]|nr:nucleotidyl transferase AbiEii/AbiGii toxin family protein [Stagnimonas sp.]